MKTKKLLVLLLALCLLLSITTSALAATNYFHWGYSLWRYFSEPLHDVCNSN
jgi:hypothetical protein